MLLSDPIYGPLILLWKHKSRGGGGALIWSSGCWVSRRHVRWAIRYGPYICTVPQLWATVVDKWWRELQGDSETRLSQGTLGFERNLVTVSALLGLNSQRTQCLQLPRVDTIWTHTAKMQREGKNPNHQNPGVCVGDRRERFKSDQTPSRLSLLLPGYLDKQPYPWDFLIPSRDLLPQHFYLICIFSLPKDWLPASLAHALISDQLLFS